MAEITNKIFQTIKECKDYQGEDYQQSATITATISQIASGKEWGGNIGGRFTLTQEDSLSIDCVIYRQETIKIVGDRNSSHYCADSRTDSLLFSLQNGDKVCVNAKIKQDKRTKDIRKNELSISSIKLLSQSPTHISQNIATFPQNTAPTQQSYIIKNKKVALITVPNTAAVGDVEHVLKGIVEIKEYFINFQKSDTVCEVCEKHCEQIKKAADDDEISCILFCCGGWDDTNCSPDWAKAFDEEDLVQAIKYAREKKKKYFITGLGHAQYHYQPNKTKADEAAIYATTPTMAAIEAACLLRFRKTWAEHIQPNIFLKFLNFFKH